MLRQLRYARRNRGGSEKADHGFGVKLRCMIRVGAGDQAEEKIDVPRQWGRGERGMLYLLHRLLWIELGEVLGAVAVLLVELFTCCTL